MRRIGIVTTSRADFGLLYPIIKRFYDNENFDTTVIATGLHLMEDHGDSIKHVKEKCKKVDIVDLFIPNTDQYTLTKSIGIGFISFAEYLKNNDFDAIIVLGDRIELIVPVYSSMICNIPVVHIFGGDNIDSYVTYDNNVRHCITKISNLHFTATQEHFDRIEKLGEERWRIFNVGSPAIEYIKKCNYLNKNQLQSKFNKINFGKPYCVLTFHPVPTEIHEIKNQISSIIEGINQTGIQVICTKPNNDIGTEYILKEIKKENDINKKFLLIDSISQEEYYSILKYCNFMIGNSSSGILESSYFKIPSINIGTRQLGRIKAENVIDVECNKDTIIKNIKRCMYDSSFKEVCKKCRRLYGEGNSSYKIVEILDKMLIDKKRLLIKKITY